ncbi:MAG TPA: hypothetical protein VF134_03955, partial [Candidatus Dormibacteraeota bacterium]
MDRIRRPSRPGACGVEVGVEGPGAASSRSFSCAPPSATLSLTPAVWNAGLPRLRPAAHPTVT